jgi:hypothetical protein
VPGVEYKQAVGVVAKLWRISGLCDVDVVLHQKLDELMCQSHDTSLRHVCELLLNPQHGFSRESVAERSQNAASCANSCGGHCTV